MGFQLFGFFLGIFPLGFFCILRGGKGWNSAGDDGRFFTMVKNLFEGTFLE
jgi:hypothetical protein